ncbi:TonB-dependent receptor [Hanstruepera neustonica]|uniref:TonB-dependent receptor n=2 Tax=Hanstruepera neustonica TaxID=1445657 RepID=A0A2K1E569_9FLAO|nr:TonB-dependent receptor [Hanstruepera neustonica]
MLLHDVLEAAEKKYGVQFNYAEDVIAGIHISPPADDLSIEDLIIFLETQSKLIFSRLNDSIILIKHHPKNLLCGYIKSSIDNLPIPLATLQKGTKGIVADNNGYFEISDYKPDDSYEIRALGHKSMILNLQDYDLNSCFTLLLEPDIQALSEIFISNYITKGISKLNNGSFNINIEEFEILPGLIDADVLNSVQAFPGILSVSETVSNINIRGGSHDQNLILWDNIKMYQSGHFFGLISMYNPQITQNVSLFKNGTDVAFSDGVSGTIAMYTEKKLNKTFNGSIGINLIDANGFADLPLGKKSSLQIAARKSISDFTKTPAYDQFFKRISQNNELQNDINSDQEFDFYDASLRWIYKINDKNELRLNFINVSNNLVFNENEIVNTVETSRESSVSQSSIAGGLQYLRKWNSKFNTTLEVYETDYKLESINANITESQRFLQKNQVSETSVKLIAEQKLNEKSHATFGYHFTETEVTNLDDVDVPRYKLLVSEVLREHSAFAKLNWKTLNKKTHVDLGFRYAYLDEFQKHILEPRLSVTHKLSNSLSIEALGEFKHQNTSQIINFQNDFLGVEKRRWQLTDNDSIPIIKSKQLSLGINFDNNDFLLSVEGYYKKVNGITSQSQGFQNDFEFAKTSGNYEVYGIDFLTRKRFDAFNLWLSYSYMDNKYHFKELYEDGFPSNFDITHAITFGSSYTINKFKLAAGLNWRTGKPLTEPIDGNDVVNNTINYAAPNSSSLESYFRVDLSALYYLDIGKKLKGQFGASVWNVFGKDNVINRYYRLSNVNLVEINELSLGFVPNVSARILF